MAMAGTLQATHARPMAQQAHQRSSARVSGSHVVHESFQRFQCSRSARQNLVVRAAEGEEAALPIERSGNNFTALKDIEAIKKVLPHRYPFLLVDRVVEWDFQKSGVGYKNITMNDNFFTGHFPERAIMPGVLQVEALAQLGGIVMLNPEDPSKDQFFFAAIDECKFKKPVVPGDTLMMRVDVTKYNKRFGIVKMDAKAYIGPDLCCEAKLTLAMGA